MDLQLLPLVPEVPLPWRAPAALRREVPRGYGVQEQCLPFTAACALGLLVPAPFDFGLCDAAEVPPAGRAFAPPEVATPPGDARVFYVIDHASSRFAGNAFTALPLPFVDTDGATKALRPQQPGISFMDRPDQTAYFKLHLPWVLRTPAGIDSLFIAPLNRPPMLQLLDGLVETDWYAHPVNLVVQRPAQGALHVRRGDVIAQVLFVDRAARRGELQVLDAASPGAALIKDELRQWFFAHAADRSTYRRMARSRQGRIESSDHSGTSGKSDNSEGSVSSDTGNASPNHPKA